MGILVTVAQLILSLSLLVVLHEGGHFFAAKFFKTKVEKFYLFFNPWFSLFKVKKGETEYGIGWLPFGGYVKIAGMIDESFDKEQLKGEVQPWEFRAKPAWQRLIIMLGGIIVNIILGIAVFIGITYSYGTSYIPNASVTNGISVDSMGYEIGLRDGDKIISIGDKTFDKFDRGRFVSSLIIDNIDKITVERANKTVDIPIESSISQTLIEAKDAMFFQARIPFTVAQIAPESAAEKSGFKVNDRIISVDNVPTLWMKETRANIKKHPNSVVSVKVIRDKKDTVVLKPELKEDAILGIAGYGADYYYSPKIEKYSLAQSIPLGVTKSWNFIAGQIKAFKKIFQGEIKAKDSVGSVISMGKLFGDTWDNQRFWTMTGMLSLILAFLNLLPIPGLDGGHAMFVLYEMITGRKPSDKVVEIATTIGFFLLIALMVFALGNDIRKLF